MKAVEGRERIEAIQRLANYPLFDRASSRSIERVVASAQLIGADADAIVRVGGTPEQHVTFLLSGSLRVFHRVEDGREFTPKLLIAPNHFGDLQQLAGGRAHVQSVEVVTSAVLALVPFAVLDEVLRDDGPLCRDWLSGLASQFISTIDSDRHNAFVPLAGRIDNVLLSYADAFGAAERGKAIVVPLSRARIAKHVGTVKRCVARVLKSFEERRVIEAHERHLVLRAPDVLAKETLPQRLGLAHRMARD